MSMGHSVVGGVATLVLVLFVFSYCALRVPVHLPGDDSTHPSENLCFNGAGAVDEIHHPGGEVETSVADFTEGVIQTMTNRLKTTSAFLLLLGSAGGLASLVRAAEPTDALTPKTFAQYQKQIKPQPGESRWMEVPWFLDLHAARQKAAAEGKPLFIYSSGGATGIGAC